MQKEYMPQSSPNYINISIIMGLPVGSVVKNPPATQEAQVQPLEKIPWERNWQPTPVFLPGKSHGQRNLAGYSPWGCKGVRYNLVTKQQQRISNYIISGAL